MDGAGQGPGRWFRKLGGGRTADLSPKILLTAAPPTLSVGSPETVITVVVTFSRPLRSPVTLRGRLFEHDALSADDHLQDFSVGVPSHSSTGMTSFPLTVKEVGGAWRLTGNTSDYSRAEKQWRVYVATEESGRVRSARSRYLELPWEE